MAQGWLLDSPLARLFLWWGHSDVNTLGSTSNEGKEKGAAVGEIRACKGDHPNGFQLPLHYPRYTKQDYDKMEDFKLDMLLKEYGLSCKGSLEEKRAYAVGAFLWPQQL